MLEFLVKSYVILGFAWGLIHAWHEGNCLKNVMSGKDVTVYGSSKEDADDLAKIVVEIVEGLRFIQRVLPNFVAVGLVAIALTLFCLFSMVSFPWQIFKAITHKHKTIVKGM